MREERLCSVCGEFSYFEGAICYECLEEEKAFLEALERSQEEEQGVEYGAN